MKLSGLLGRSDTLEPSTIAGQPSKRSNPLLDVRADEPGMITVYVEAEPVVNVLSASSEIQCVADMVWGTNGSEHRVSFDVLRGVAISVVAQSLRLSARNLGNRSMYVRANAGGAARAAARAAQLTSVGASLPGGTSATFEVPAYAAWVELWRSRERETECEIDFAYPAPAAALYTARAQPGERMERMPIGNGVTLVTVRNTGPAGAEPTSDVSVASAFNPVLVWGLWL